MTPSKPIVLGRADNPEIAQQWIDYLQKKNAVLTMVWSIMLVIIIALSFASFYFYHHYQGSLKSDQIRLNELSELTEERDGWRVKAFAFEKNTVELAQELELVQAVKHGLEQQKSKTSGLLSEKNRLADAMKLQVTQLEKDNLELTQQILLSQKAFAEYKQASQQQIVSLKGKFGQQTQALNDRKGAFEALAKRQKESQKEMERLSGLLAKEQTALLKLRKQRDALTKSLKTTQQQLATAEQEYQSLERKFEFAIAPISSNKDKNKLRETAAGKLTKNDAASLKVSEPVVKKDLKTEVKKSGGSASTAFDFQTIAID